MKSMSLVVAVMSLMLAACSTTSPDVIKREDAQRMSNVLDGVVLSTRPVTVEGSQSGLGAAAGGVVGGVAGSHVGKGSGGRTEEEALHASDRTADSRLCGPARADLLLFVAEL